MRAYNKTKVFAPGSALLFKSCPWLVYLHANRLRRSRVTCNCDGNLQFVQLYNPQELLRSIYQYEMV